MSGVVTSLSDLLGKTIAFDDSFSTTGYMLPLAKLLESGLNPVEKSMPSISVAGDAVGYIFTADDENSIEWLLGERVAAAAVDNISFEQLSPEIKERAIVLAETEKVARHLVLVRGDMPPEQIEEISSVLLEMDKTAEGKTALEKFEQTSKFDKFPSAESLNRIQEIYQKTQNP